MQVECGGDGARLANLHVRHAVAARGAGDVAAVALSDAVVGHHAVHGPATGDLPVGALVEAATAELVAHDALAGDLSLRLAACSLTRRTSSGYSSATAGSSASLSARWITRCRRVPSCVMQDTSSPSRARRRIRSARELRPMLAAEGHDGQNREICRLLRGGRTRHVRHHEVDSLLKVIRPQVDAGHVRSEEH